MFEAKDRGYRWGKFMPLPLWNYLYLAKKLARFMSDCRVLLLLTAGSLSRTSSVRPASDPSLSVSSQFLRKTPLNIFETPFEILLIAPSVVSFKHPIDQNIFQKQMWMKKIGINEKRTRNLRALGVL